MTFGQVGDATFGVHPDFRTFERDLTSGVQRAMTNASRVAKPLAIRVDTTSFARNLVGVAGSVQIGRKIQESIGAAVDLAEQGNKVRVVFGEMTGAVEDFAEGAASALGQSEAQALAAAGTFGNLFRSMEIGVEKSAEMSIGLVKLASDLASFNNVDPAEALLALRAGLVGEIEPLRRFGVNLNQATLEQEAMNLGLLKGGQELTAAAKAQAAYSIILGQTRLAQGDFARTSSSAANQQRILAAETTNLQAKIGGDLLPVYKEVLSITRAAVGAFSELPDPIRTLVVDVGALALGFGALSLTSRTLFGIGLVEGARAAAAGVRAYAVSTLLARDAAVAAGVAQQAQIVLYGREAAASTAVLAAEARIRASKVASATTAAATAAAEVAASDARLLGILRTEKAAGDARLLSVLRGEQAIVASQGRLAGLFTTGFGNAAIGIGITAAVAAGLVTLTGVIDNVADAIENKFNPGIVDAREKLLQTVQAVDVVERRFGIFTRSLSGDVDQFVKTNDLNAQQVERLTAHFDIAVAAAERFGVGSREVTHVLELLAAGNVKAATAEVGHAAILRQVESQLSEVGAAVADYQTQVSASVDTTGELARAELEFRNAVKLTGTTTEAGIDATARLARAIFLAKQEQAEKMGVDFDAAAAQKEAGEAALKMAEDYQTAATAIAKASDEIAASNLKANQQLLGSFVENERRIVEARSTSGSSASKLAEQEEEANRSRIRGNLGLIASFNELVETEVEGNRERTRAQLEADRQRVASNLSLIASFNDITGAAEQTEVEIGVVHGFGLTAAEIAKRKQGEVQEQGIKDFSKATATNAKIFAQFIADVNAIFEAGAPNLASQLLAAGPEAATAARQAAERIGKPDGLGALEKVASAAVKAAKKTADDELLKWGENFRGMGESAAEGLDAGLASFVEVTERNTAVFTQFISDVNAIFAAGAPALASQLLALGPSGAKAAAEAAAQIGTEGLGKLESIAQKAIVAAKLKADDELEKWGPNFAEKGRAAGGAVRAALDQELSLTDWQKTTQSGNAAFEQFVSDVNAIFEAGAPFLAKAILELGVDGAKVARQAAARIGGKGGLGALEKIAVQSALLAKKEIDAQLDTWQVNFEGKGNQAVDAFRKGLEDFPELRDSVEAPMTLDLDLSNFDPAMKSALESLNKYGLLKPIAELRADGSQAAKEVELRIAQMLGFVSPSGQPNRQWTAIMRAIDNGSIADLDERLNVAARDRTVEITAELLKGPLGQIILTELENNPDAKLNVGAIEIFGGGGNFSRNQFGIVGDRGPELVRFGAPGQVFSAEDTERILAGLGGRPIVVNVYDSSGDPRAVGWWAAREVAFEASRGS